MILDHLDYSDKYASLHPAFADAFKFLKTFDATNAPAGKTELENDTRLLVQRYNTISPEAGVWEAHRKYIDIQYVFSGNETIGYAAINTLTSSTPYDAEHDVEFFEKPSNPAGLKLTPGYFTIFYPEDVHSPCLQTGTEPEAVVKVLFKIAVRF